MQKKKTRRAKNGHFVQLSDPLRQYGENLVENRSLSIWEYLSAFRAFHQYRERGVEATYALETKE